MKNRGHITGFYLETLLLIVVFIAIILVITQVFGVGKAQSTEARLLTNAVTLTQNAAEAFYAAEDEADLITLLNENGNTGALPEDGRNGAVAYYKADMTPEPGPGYRLIVRVEWTEQDSLRNGSVFVTDAESGKTVYTLSLCKDTEVTP